MSSLRRCWSILASRRYWIGRAGSARRRAGLSRSGPAPIPSCCATFVSLPAVRRADVVDEVVLGKAAEALRPGMSVAEAEQASGVDALTVRPATLSLLWQCSWVTDLTKSLSADLHRGITSFRSWGATRRPGPADRYHQAAQDGGVVPSSARELAVGRRGPGSPA